MTQIDSMMHAVLPVVSEARQLQSCSELSMSFGLYYLHKDRIHNKSKLYSEIRCVIKMDMYNAYICQ